jgi:hypothetical protein
MRSKLKSKNNFTVDDISGLDLKKLSVFKLQSTSLFTVINKIAPQLIEFKGKVDLKLTNQRSE